MFYLYKSLTGFLPNNIHLYKLAFLHSSAYFKDKNDHLINNERLEFLGDAVYDTIISEFLYNHYSDKNEGFLSQMRAKIVNRECLNECADKMKLKELIVANISDESFPKDISGNTLEALIGAVFVDHGYKKTAKFVHRKIIAGHINLAEIEEKEINFKGRLFEWAQKNKIEVSFLTSEKLNFHNTHVFYCEVKTGDSIMGKGEGYSKKEAEKEAAKNAINGLNEKISASF